MESLPPTRASRRGQGYLVPFRPPDAPCRPFLGGALFHEAVRRGTECADGLHIRVTARRAAPSGALACTQALCARVDGHGLRHCVVWDAGPSAIRYLTNEAGRLCGGCETRLSTSS